MSDKDENNQIAETLIKELESDIQSEFENVLSQIETLAEKYENKK